MVGYPEGLEALGSCCRPEEGSCAGPDIEPLLACKAAGGPFEALLDAETWEELFVKIFSKVSLIV
jgi:hypothetical protein